MEENIKNWLLGNHSQKDFEMWILKHLSQYIKADGLIFARHIETVGLIGYTAKIGKVEKHELSYLPKDNTIVGHTISTQKELIINDIEDFPEEIKPKKWNNKEKYMFIPLIIEKDPIKEKKKAYGVIIFFRKGTIFSTEDIQKIKPFIYQVNYTLEVFLNILYLNKLKKINKNINLLNIEAIKDPGRNSKFLKNYLNLAIATIDAADKGSILIETYRGMKFITAIGYNEEQLESLPPLSLKSSQILPHIPNNSHSLSSKCIPKIIHGEDLEKIINKGVIANITKQEKPIKAILNIPIYTSRGNLLEVNLDNTSSGVFFDDIDIEIAKQIAVHISTSYELMKRNRTIRKHSAIIKQIRNLVENPPQIKNKRKRSIFQESLIRSLMVLEPEIIMIMETIQRNPEIIYQIDNIHPQIPNHLSKLIKKQTIHSKPYTLLGFERYEILVINHKTLNNNRIYVGLARKDMPWSGSDINHIITTIGTLYLIISNFAFTEELKATQQDTLKTLGKALEYRDLETKGHIWRTTLLTKELARRVKFPDRRGIIWGAYVHDIGKIAIPDYILLKPGKLSVEEFEIIKKHVIYGYELIRGIRRIPKTTLNVVKYHHEKWDGTGYPEGLKGDNIPLEARIFAVVDVFDALISKRPYKEKWPLNKAIEVIKQGAGNHFDPEITKIFIDVINDQNIINKLYI